MTTWIQISNQEALLSWDQMLMGFSDASIYQSYFWGEYRGKLGWQVQRWRAVSENGDTRALAQVLVKKYPMNCAVVWCWGGPVGDLELVNEDFCETLKSCLDVKRIYIKILPQRVYHVDDVITLKYNNWVRSPFSLGTSLTYVLSLKEPLEILQKNLARLWKRSLKKFVEAGCTIQVWANPDLHEVFELLSKMEKIKNIGEQFSKKSLECLFELGSKSIVLLQARDKNGILVGMRACIYFQHHALDLIAAVNEVGRDVSAGYALLWQLIQTSRDRGALDYDMGAIDPHHNKGVFHFNRGTGAEPFGYLGEWEWSNSRLLKFLIELKVRLGRK